MEMTASTSTGLTFRDVDVDALARRCCGPFEGGDELLGRRRRRVISSLLLSARRDTTTTTTTTTAAASWASSSRWLYAATACSVASA